MKKLELSRFAGETPPPLDPVLGPYAQSQKDMRPDKAVLLVGMYANKNGHIPAMRAVEKAQKRVLDRTSSHAYHNVPGYAPYLAAIQSSMFRKALHPRIASVQTPGGTGGLSTILGYLKSKRFTQLLVADKTWDIHNRIGRELGYGVKSYPYLCKASKGVAFEKMLAYLEAVPADLASQTVVMLQGACQNPTGADLSTDQWRAIGDLANRKDVFLLVDLAYQGYHKGVWADAEPVRILEEMGLEFGVVTSCSKNLSMYCLRLGAAHIVCLNASNVAAVQGRMADVMRWNFSTCQLQTAQVVAEIYQDKALKKLWLAELAGNRNRIKQMRAQFVEGMASRGYPGFGFVNQQNGLFSFTGLSKEMAEWMRDKFAVYILNDGNGRMCLPGLNASNINQVCDAIAATLQHFACMDYSS